MSEETAREAGRPKVVVAKTGLDGHWRGVRAVARAMREAGFEVVLLGMANADQIVAAVSQEDPALLGLNVGGRVEVVERILDELDEALAGDEIPVLAGGTIPPWASERLEGRGVHCFPPGSSLDDIVGLARRLVEERRGNGS